MRFYQQGSLYKPFFFSLRSFKFRFAGTIVASFAQKGKSDKKPVGAAYADGLFRKKKNGDRSQKEKKIANLPVLDRAIKGTAGGRAAALVGGVQFLGVIGQLHADAGSLGDKHTAILKAERLFDHSIFCTI